MQGLIQVALPPIQKARVVIEKVSLQAGGACFG